jgi:sulfite exporter TauE/SafE/copper chaperone CopZ
MPQAKTYTYSVSGTHCRSCELIIESEIKKLKGIQSVIVSNSSGTVQITAKKQPDIDHLNHLFKPNGYVFSNFGVPAYQGISAPNIINSILIVATILTIFYFLNQSSLFSQISVTPDSLPLAFFPFGLLAGFSTCAALIGGIALSVGNPLTFNLGRLLSFTFFGGLLGLIGQTIHLSLTAGSVLTIFISLAMVILGLQILGIKIPLTIPSFSLIPQTKLPIFAGAATFFLPCGFTLTAQSLALASGSLLTGAKILGFFALGTAIPLYLIGRFQHTIKGHSLASQVAGLLIIAMAFFNISSQLTVLGLNPVPSSTVYGSRLTDNENLPPQKNGVQILKMTANSRGYSPSTFKVRANVPIRWEITDTGTSGCTNAIIARQLFDGPINLVPGTTSVREFTISRPGVYRFSCWMGMVSGTITAI